MGNRTDSVFESIFSVFIVAAFLYWFIMFFGQEVLQFNSSHKIITRPGSNQPSKKIRKSSSKTIDAVIDNSNKEEEKTKQPIENKKDIQFHNFEWHFIFTLTFNFCHLNFIGVKQLLALVYGKILMQNTDKQWAPKGPGPEPRTTDNRMETANLRNLQISLSTQTTYKEASCV